jgi:1,2-diacylglycerol 3-beta-galactosyltransferase
VPLIITGYIPGQEDGNVAWVERAGAGVLAEDPDAVAARVADWLRPGNTALAEMATNVSALAVPDAAGAIADTALALLNVRANV